MRIATDHLLTNRPLFAGEDIDEAHEVLSHLFTEVTLAPGPKGRYSAIVNGVQLPRSTVCYCANPDGMAADTLAPLDFHAIQLPFTSGIQYCINDQSVAADTEHGVVLSAGEQVGLEAAPRSAVLNFIVGKDVMQDVLTVVTGRASLPEIRFAPRFDPTRPPTASLLALLTNFTNELNRPGGISESPAAVASFEHALTTFMLFGLEHDLSDVLRAPSPDAGAAQVRLVEEYITVHAAEPVNIETIARETGHSASSIFRTFRKHRDYTPMQFLRNRRMMLVRTRLLKANAAESVSQIAFDCGFTHLGRFAVDYRRRFGEAPSETLSRVGKQLKF